MRTAVIVIVILFILAGCVDQPEKTGGAPAKEEIIMDTSEFTTIQWTDTARDFGRITEGEKLQVNFSYKNTGDKPLVIYMVKPGCGCTLAETPGKPLAPGETGEIKALFNSEGKPGMQYKTINVDANTKDTRLHQLSFQVEVIPKK
jgi:hypothetical protein